MIRTTYGRTSIMYVFFQMSVDGFAMIVYACLMKMYDLFECLSICVCDVFVLFSFSVRN